MKDIKNKINNVTTEEGFLTAEDTNSIINELKNAVSVQLNLNGNDTKQLAKAIDVASKSLTYVDIGSKNHVKLVRTGTQDQIETLIDNSTVFFTPKNANDGDFKIKLNSIAEKDAVNATGSNYAGFLQVDELYVAIFDKADDKFKVYQVSINASEYKTVKAANGDRNKINVRIDNLTDTVDDEVKRLDDRIDDISINVDFGTL